MRLIDALTGDSARSANYLPEDTNLFQTWLQQSWGAADIESVQPTFQSYAERGYGGNAVVFGLILARSSLLSEATFRWQNLTTKELFGSAELRKLEQPWPNGTTGELLVRMEQDVSLAGNAYIRDDGDRLVRLRPDWVQIILQPSGQDEGKTRYDVDGYMYWPRGLGGGADPEIYTVDEVAHWSPIPDPLATYRGMSWLTPVVREINADIGMTEHKRRFLDNNATPNLLIKFQQKLTPEAVRRVGEQWHAKYGGPDGLSTAVLDNGADATVLGSDLASMNFADVQAAGENRIAVASGVPGIVAGLKEGLSAATYSNYEQAMRRFADLFGRPQWRSACACLEQLVTPPAGSRLWFDVSDIAALRQGEKERADTLQVLSTTAKTLIDAGYDPDTVTKAVMSGDMSLLTHTGLVSVQLLPKGQVLPSTAIADEAATATTGSDAGTPPPVPTTPGATP